MSKPKYYARYCVGENETIRPWIWANPRAPRNPQKEQALNAIVMAVIVLVVVFVVTMASAERYLVNVDSDSHLNVREGAGLDCDVYMTLERGQAVELESIDRHGWAYIHEGSESGYCRIEYLADELPEEYEICQTSAGRVRVRRYPSTDAPEVRTMRKKGMPVTVGCYLTVDGTRWANVGDGFVMADYLTDGQK